MTTNASDVDYEAVPFLSIAKWLKRKYAHTSGCKCCILPEVRDRSRKEASRSRPVGDRPRGYDVMATRKVHPCPSATLWWIFFSIV